MKKMRFLKGAAVSIACWNMLLPVANLQAATPAAPAKAPAVMDVSLQSGTLNGQVLDAQGLGLEGAVVSVRQEKQEIAQAVAGKNGEFTVANLKGGMYQVSVGQTSTLCRFWASHTAPPSAKSALRIVSDKDAVVRGQDCGDCGCGTDWIGVLTLGASLGALAVSAVALSEINDVNDDLDDIQSDDLPATP